MTTATAQDKVSRIRQSLAERRELANQRFASVAATPESAAATSRFSHVNSLAGSSLNREKLNELLQSLNEKRQAADTSAIALRDTDTGLLVPGMTPAGAPRPLAKIVS